MVRFQNSALLLGVDFYFLGGWGGALDERNEITVCTGDNE